MEKNNLIVNEKNLIDFEKKLWAVAEKLRGNLSAEDYMHVVIGIITLKYLSDKFDDAHKKLIKDGFDNQTLLEMKDAYRQYSAIYIPELSRWNNIVDAVGTNSLGRTIDKAISELGKEYPELDGVFTTKYSEIDQIKLGDVINIFNDMHLTDHDYDLLGHIYEFFLGKFFLDRGQKGGEFYTPRSIVKLMTSFLNIKKGKIYDPACGSGGMLVCAKKYIESQDGNVNEISVFGQECNKTTRNLALLNLILNGMLITAQGIDGHIINVLGSKSACTFNDDQHKGFKFDYIMANPPFNYKGWYNESLAKDERWVYGLPQAGNANFAWLQHILYKMSENGKAGVVLANGSLTSTTGGDDKIRKGIIESNKISCIVALPDKLFFTTGISACIWFFDNNKKTKDVLFIDAQNLGTLIPGSKKNKEIVNEEIEKLSDIFHNFEKGEEINIPGLAKSVPLSEIEKNDFSLLPGRYIEIDESEQKNKEEIEKELMLNITELTKLLDETKEIENKLKDAISKLTFGKEVK